MAEKNYQAHESAIVDPGARVGEGTRIWHFCHVSSGAHIGDGCVLGQNVFVGNRARIGNGVKIQNNVSIYDEVLIDDDVFCGPSMVFTNVINPRSFIERKDEYRVTRIGRGATLGANSTIICGITVGCYAMVGAGAVVTINVPDFALMLGVPARLRGWVCRCGLTLAAPEGQPPQTRCVACGATYQLAATGEELSYRP